VPDLHDEAAVAPEQVDFVAVDLHIRLGCGQLCLSDQGEGSALGLGAGQGRLLDEGAEASGARPVAEGRDVARFEEAADLGLVECALEEVVCRVCGCGEVEERAQGGGGRDAVDDSALVSRQLADAVDPDGAQAAIPTGDRDVPHRGAAPRDQLEEGDGRGPAERR
jgi:hypothetical protein